MNTQVVVSLLTIQELKCFEMIKVADCHSLMHQCLYFQYQAMSRKSLLDSPYVPMTLLKLTAKELSEKINITFVNIMMKWVDTSSCLNFEVDREGLCQIQWSFKSQPDRSMKKKLPKEVRLGVDQYENALRCIMQKVKAQGLTDTFSVSVAAPKKRAH